MSNQENNKLIAEFMGMANERHSDGRYLFTTDIDELKGADTRFWEELYFHVSWDWLMPVVETCYHNGADGDEIGDITHGLLDCDIDQTYKAVVKFINEYNN